MNRRTIMETASTGTERSAANNYVRGKKNVVCSDVKWVTKEQTHEFGTVKGNRLIKASHVAKLAKAFRDSPTVIPPISVNIRTNHIIDGQHRLKAYHRLLADCEIPDDTMIRVMYVDIPIEEEWAYVVEANINSKSWSIDNFIESYIACNNLYYIRLKNWCLAHSLTRDKDKAKYRYGAAMITGKGCGNDLKKELFTFTEEEFKRADDVHSEMVEIINTLGIDNYGPWIEQMAASWVSKRGRYNFDAMVKAMKKNKAYINNMPKQKIADWNAIFAYAFSEIPVGAE